MTARFTVVVRRGLKRLAALAESDLEVDQSEEMPRFSKKEAAEMRRALAWIGQLGDEPPMRYEATSRKAQRTG